MPTKKPRINVTFEEPIANLLNALATQEHKSLASMVKELAIEALERREDKALSNLAEKLDAQNKQTYSHDEAWG